MNVLALGSSILRRFPHRHYHPAGDSVPSGRQLGFGDADVSGERAVFEADRHGDEAAPAERRLALTAVAQSTSFTGRPIAAGIAVSIARPHIPARYR